MNRPSPLSLLPAVPCLVAGFVAGQLFAKAPIEATEEEALDGSANARAIMADRAEAQDPVTSRAGRAASVERQAADAAAADRTEAVQALSEEGGGMAGELDRLLASGRIQARLVEDESTLQNFLYEQYLALGDHAAAWKLLENSDATTRQWSLLSVRMNQAGDGAGAVAGWQRGARLLIHGSSTADGLDHQGQVLLGGCLNAMRDVDPQAAMAMLEEVEAVSTTLLALSDYDRVKFLLSAGREADAFEVFDTAMQSEFDRDSDIEMILQADSAMAEGYLRRFMELNGSDPYLEAALAQTLFDQGRTGEALEWIDAAIESGDTAGLDQLRHLLKRLPSDAVAERVDSWVESMGGLSHGDTGARTLRDAMQFYAEVGRPEDAVGVQLMILDGIASGESPGGWMPKLPDELAQQYASQIAPSVLAAELRAGSDDQLWGDLGDMYWKMGYRHDAQRCWEQANQIDPGDIKWTGYLHALANGQSPH